jgi:glycosyltransferase involved in cell wall biosynthesis
VVIMIGDSEIASNLSRPLRVLMVCTRYLPELGGIETHVYEVSRRLAGVADFDITVLTTDITRRLPPQEVINGITVLRVPAWPRGHDYYFAPKIASLVGNRDRWDLVHCQGIHSAVPPLAMLAARRAGMPYMVTFHTGGHSKRLRNSLRSAQWRILGSLLRDACALVGVSNFEADALSRHARLQKEQVTIIRNGGTLPAASPEVAAIPGRIVSCGRLERYKGHHRVIEALPYMIEEMPEAHLVVLGSGPYETELRRLADRLCVTDRLAITHIPPVDRTAMAAALAESSVVAALSDYEAHPVGVMEAISLGRPVVGFDIAGIGELVTKGWVHGVSPKASPVQIADQIIEAMSSHYRSQHDELPTWETCAEQLAGIYRAAARGILYAHAWT